MDESAGGADGCVADAVVGRSVVLSGSDGCVADAVVGRSAGEWIGWMCSRCGRRAFGGAKWIGWDRILVVFSRRDGVGSDGEG